MQEASSNRTVVNRFEEGKELEVERNKELAKDIHELQEKIGAALDYCLELYQRHGDQPGWEMVENKLNLAAGWAQLPLEPEPEGEE